MCECVCERVYVMAVRVHVKSILMNTHYITLHTHCVMHIHIHTSLPVVVCGSCKRLFIEGNSSLNE
jgi:hypothetical protein